jgi:hypothetical protein
VQKSPEAVLIGAMAAFAFTGATAFVLSKRWEATVLVEPPVAIIEPAVAPLDPTGWFAGVRQFCNPVEVETRMRLDPAPPTPEGAMHEAACYALAGQIDRAREVIGGLQPDRRYEAAGVVFEAGHPAADAGDDIAAGPLMELVVEFWPNHYMALYHGGAARYELGDYPTAQKYLERFMVEYPTEDGWRSSARAMLDAISDAK